jgi:hypothetical protein
MFHEHNNPIVLELIDKIKSVSLENLYESHESRKRLIKYCIFIELLIYNHINNELFIHYNGVEILILIL